MPVPDPNTCPDPLPPIPNQLYAPHTLLPPTPTDPMPANSLTPESTPLKPSVCLAPFPIPVLAVPSPVFALNAGKSLSQTIGNTDGNLDDDGIFDGRYVLLDIGAQGLVVVEVVVEEALLLFAAIHDMYV